jgi:hypothetical protein
MHVQRRKKPHTTFSQYLSFPLFHKVTSTRNEASDAPTMPRPKLPVPESLANNKIYRESGTQLGFTESPGHLVQRLHTT